MFFQFQFLIFQPELEVEQQQSPQWMDKVSMSSMKKNFMSWIAQIDANGLLCHKHSQRLSDGPL